MPAASRAGADRYRRDPGLVDRAVEAIVREYQPAKIIVFGSFARGDTHELSDLDLVVIKERGERFFRRIGRVRDACDGIPVDLQPFVYTPAEFNEMIERGSSFLEAVLSEGKTVYDAAA